MGMICSCVVKRKVDFNTEIVRTEKSNVEVANTEVTKTEIVEEVILEIANSEYRNSEGRDDGYKNDEDTDSQCRNGEDRGSEGRKGEDIEYKNGEGADYCSNSISLVNLPAELLVKILYYLPTRDKLMMRQVSRRFQDVSEVPSLWEEFVISYGFHHVCQVINLLKVYGEHVREIYIPGHVGPTKALEMLHYCTNVIHLMVPRISQFCSQDLGKVLCMLPHLHRLDVKLLDGDEELIRDCDSTNSLQLTYYEQLKSSYMQILLNEMQRACDESWRDRLRNLDELRFNEIRRLDELPFDNESLCDESCPDELQSEGQDYLLNDNCHYTVESILGCARLSYPIPPVINIFQYKSDPLREIKTLPRDMIFRLFEFWFESHSQLPSFFISLYIPNGVPKAFHSLVPYQRLHFGPEANFSPLVRLYALGLEGLFHLRSYEHNGEARYAISPVWYMFDEYSDYITCFDCSIFVSYINISNSHVSSYHLERLSVLYPNLQILDLERNSECLDDLQGIRSIVHTCENLEILRLAEISQTSCDESVLVLWGLLSSLKKLTYLTIDWPWIQLDDPDDTSRQKLIDMFKCCQSLQCLDIGLSLHSKHSGVADFSFLSCPSLTHCTMQKYHFQHYRIAFPITRHLQTLQIQSWELDLDDRLIEVLSSYELRDVDLDVRSVTIPSVRILISNLPNLVSLRVVVLRPLLNEDGRELEHRLRDYTDSVMNMFPCYKGYISIFKHYQWP